MSIVVPAILPISRKDFDDKLAHFVQIPRIKRIQIDVVDGHVASPVSWPYTAPKELQDMLERKEMLPNLDRIEYEIDFMCLDVERAAGSWLTLGASRLTIHIDNDADLTLFSSVRRHYSDDFISFGLAIGITTDPVILESHLAEATYVQFMGIATIGRQAEPFDSRVLDRVRSFRSHHPDIPVQVDGGVSLVSAHELIALGVKNLVVGSALRHVPDVEAEIEKFDAFRNPFNA